MHASFVPRFKKGMRLGACFLCSYQEFITIRGSYTLFLKLFSPASVISPSPHTSGSALCMCVCTLVCLFAAIYLLNVFHEDRAHALGKYRGRDIVQVEHQWAGAETTLVEACMATYYSFVHLWIINGRSLIPRPLPRRRGLVHTVCACA